MSVSRPRVAWFTPFHKGNSIAQFSQTVTAELANDAQVDLWVAETANLLDTSARVVPYASFSHYENWLDDYDYVVYNLADDCEHHWRIYEASQRHKGIVVLHDCALNRFFIDYYSETGQAERYEEAMKRGNGSDPLLQEAIVGALGVIVHSRFLSDLVRERSCSPIAQIYLAHAVDQTSPVWSRTDLGIPADRVLLTTIGQVNQNKRIETILRVIASDADLKSRIHYMIVGSSDSPYGRSMLELCRELELQDVVSFTGYVEESLLRAVLAHADVCINLRWPAMECGSSSIIREMLLGRATVVTDTGVYSELPDDSVSKVRPEHEFDDLSRHLHDLVLNDAMRRAKGEAALRFASQHFNAKTYALQFLDFCGELAMYQPAFRLAELVAGELKAIGVSADMAIVDTVARQSAALLDGEWDPPILRKANV